MALFYGSLNGIRQLSSYQIGHRQEGVRILYFLSVFTLELNLPVSYVCLMMGLCSEKYVIRQFHHCTNIRVHSYKIRCIDYYTPKLCEIYQCMCLQDVIMWLMIVLTNIFCHELHCSFFLM
jgi:hypothetical protein